MATKRKGSTWLKLWKSGGVVVLACLIPYCVWSIALAWAKYSFATRWPSLERGVDDNIIFCVIVALLLAGVVCFMGAAYTSIKIWYKWLKS